MTTSAQHLNILWIGPKGWLRAVRFNVMTLKIVSFPTVFADSTLRNNFRNNFADRMRSFRVASIPFWMVGSSHSESPCSSHARYRAVFSSAAPSFANLKLFSALLTSAVKYRFDSSSLDFYRTLSRASVCVAAYMRVRPSKLNATGRASKSCATSPINLSLESCHA